MQPDESASQSRFFRSPALLLFLLSPVYGELVSAFLSPLEFLNPVRLAITLVPYGCGALAAREFVVRRGKGLARLLLVGLAFGLFFEGIVTRVLFNPEWGGLGSLSNYGRAAGVSWVLSVGIVHFQAVVSIVCPILTVEALFPERRHESWIGGIKLILCWYALPVWTLVMGLLVPYFPPIPHAVTLIALVLALLVGAGLIPAHRERSGTESPPSPVLFALLGGVAMSLIMAGTYILPDRAFRPAASVTFFALLTIMLVEFGLLLWLSRGESWQDPHRVSFVLGALAFFLVFGVLKDWETFTGRSLVSAVTLWLLVRLLQRMPSPQPLSTAAE